MKSMILLYEMSLAEYHEKKFPAWIANIRGEELMFEFTCDDQECEGVRGACIVRVWRKSMQRRAREWKRNGTA